MKNLFLSLLLGILLGGLYSCDKNEEPAVEVTQFTYLLNNAPKSSTPNGELYEDNSIVLPGPLFSQVFIYIEELSFDTFFFSQKSFSRAIAFPEGIEKRYFANRLEEENGFVKINEFNENDLTISGSFAFRGFLGNQSVEITNGLFENLKLTKKTGYYRDGKIDAKIDGIAYKYLDFYVQDHADYISLSILRQPSGQEISLQIPKTISTGTSPIVEGDLGNREAAVVWFQKRVGGSIHYMPLEGATIDIFTVDFEQKILKGNIRGAFADDADGIVDIEKLELDLNWN